MPDKPRNISKTHQNTESTQTHDLDTTRADVPERELTIDDLPIRNVETVQV